MSLKSSAAPATESVSRTCASLTPKCARSCCGSVFLSQNMRSVCGRCRRGRGCGRKLFRDLDGDLPLALHGLELGVHRMAGKLRELSFESGILALTGAGEFPK